LVGNEVWLEFFPPDLLFLWFQLFERTLRTGGGALIDNLTRTSDNIFVYTFIQAVNDVKGKRRLSEFADEKLLGLSIIS
jgi:hypothetical protein